MNPHDPQQEQADGQAKPTVEKNSNTLAHDLGRQLSHLEGVVGSAGYVKGLEVAQEWRKRRNKHQDQG